MAFALSSLNNCDSPIFNFLLGIIKFYIHAGVFQGNTFYIQSIGSGLGGLMKFSNLLNKRFSNPLIEILLTILIVLVVGFLIGFLSDFLIILLIKFKVLSFKSYFLMNSFNFKFIWIGFLTLINKLTNKLLKKYNKGSISIINIQHSSTDTNDSRYLIITILNSNIFDLDITLKYIYYALMNNPTFLNFGENKVIITSGIVNGMEISLHKNVFIKNNTSWEDFYACIQEDLDKRYVPGSGYISQPIYTFTVKVWNMDNYKNKHIKLSRKAGRNIFTIQPLSTYNREGFKNVRGYSTISSNNHKTKYSSNKFITPIISKNSKVMSDFDKINKLKRFLTLDIETVNVDGLQIPICITIAYNLDLNNLDLSLLESKMFLVSKIFRKQRYSCS